MALVILAMLLVVVLGLAIVGVVAVPAHREGREVLTAKGEGVARTAQKRLAAFAREAGRRRRSGT